MIHVEKPAVVHVTEIINVLIRAAHITHMNSLPNCAGAGMKHAQTITIVQVFPIGPENWPMTQILSHLPIIVPPV